MTQATSPDHVAARTFTIERVFNAPREKVFAAFTDCKHLLKWWGSAGWPLAHCDMDFRVGGSWHYAMRETATGNESWGLMFFDEIVAPEMLRYRDVFSDASRTISPNIPETATTMRFVAEGDKTRIQSTTLFESEEALKQVIEMGMADGLKEMWDQLEAYVSA